MRGHSLLQRFALGMDSSLCGKPLSPEDRKVWQQAIAMLIGLKVRNGLDERDLLAAVVETALHRGCAALTASCKRTCEDCGIKVAKRGAALAEGGERSPRPGNSKTHRAPDLHRVSSLLQATHITRGSDHSDDRRWQALGCWRMRRSGGALAVQRCTRGRWTSATRSARAAA